MPDTHTRVGSVMLVLLAVGAVTVGTVAGTASPAAGQEEVTLTVSVVDESGNSLDGVEISATWGDDGGPRNATTAGNGRAFLDVPEGADVTLTVERRFYTRNGPYVVEDATEREVTVEMAREGDATITVTDVNGPVADAAVRLFQDGQPVIADRTDSDGTFTTGDIEQDEYTLITFKEGYLRNRTELTVDGTVRQSMFIEQDSVLATFRVRDDHFAQPRPVEGADVTIPGVADVTTQGNGEVSVSIPVNDEYDVTITKPGYGTDTATLDIDESQTSLNATIQRIPGLSVETGVRRVVVGESVTVRVTDEYDERVAGATVMLEGSTVGETGADGTLDVPVEQPGNQTIRVESDELVARTTVEGVQPALDETPTATPTPSPTATPEPTSGLGPGFGPAGALVAVLAGVALLARRRR